MSLIKVKDDETYELVDYCALSRDRQVELQAKLSPGRYIVLPRTTGGLMVNKPKILAQEPPSTLINQDGELTAAFANVIEDIFRKFDLFIGRELNYQEFKILYRMIGGGHDLTQDEFEERFL